MAFSALGKMVGKRSPAPSPGSTFAPSPFTSNWSVADSEYQHLAELDLPPAAGPPRAGAWRGAGRLAKLAVLPLLLAAALAGLLLASGWRAASPQPRIWDPDLRREFSTEPLAKSVIRRFDAYNMARGGRDDPATFRANVMNYMAPDLLYESVGFGTWRTPAGWARGEEHNYGMAFPETVFTQMLFFGDEEVSTTTTYGSALWGGDLFGIPAPRRWVTLRITDFYKIRREAPGWGRVSYNFMMIDWVDVLRQVGRRMLPPPPLEEGLVLPPAANDGVPAPLSALVQAQGRDRAAAAAVARAALEEDWASGAAAAGRSWHSNLTYYGPGGIGLARNASDYTQHVLAPFRSSFAERKVALELLTCEGNYCGAFGRLRGVGVGRWLGLPTEGRAVALRFAMHYRIVGGKVMEGWTIFDFPGLFQQVGLDFYQLAAAGGRA